MSRPRIVERPVTAAVLLAGLGLLAGALDFDEPTALDHAFRRIARTPRGRAIAPIMSPLFPVGLPGGYITIAIATAHWLRRHGRTGGGRVVASAWAGWLAHRAVKLAYRRQRPLRSGERVRTDSYPSGHTTGATALAVTAAAVLHREGVLRAKPAIALAVGAPLVMGAYRVIADDHWTTDVVGGWLLGGAVAACCAPPRERVTAACRRPSLRRVRQATPTSAA